MHKAIIMIRFLALGVALWATSSVATAITLSQFNNFVFNSPIGIDFHEPTSQLLMSVNYPTGSPHNYDLVAAGTGTPTQFGPVAGLTEEVKIATVRAGPHQGGFAVGEAFSGNGVPGSVVRLHPDGTPFNPVFPYTWATLPGELNLLRGSLFQDRFGVAGGDLIVATGNEENGDPTNDHAGNVWRVNSSGVATLVATIGRHLEGVTTVPNDPVMFGPLAGKIIAGDEDFVNAPACTGAADPSTCNGSEGKIWAVDPTTGNVFTIGGGVGSGIACVGSTGTPNGCHYHTAIHFNVEDLDIIRANAEFFGVAFRDGLVLTAAASDFTGLCGQVLVTQEFPWSTANTGLVNGTSGLSALGWNGSSFVVTPLASNRTVQQWEHTTFTSGQDCFGINIVKTPKNGTFTQGGQATFTMVVTATGGIADTNVVLTDQLPGNGGLVWTSATASNGAPCTIVSNLLTCQLGTIQPGAANAVTIVVKTDTTTPAAACQSQPNPDAHVTADHGLVADDSGSLSCTPSPQLKVVKSPKNGTFTQGGQTSFTIVVSNPAAGSSSATNVVLTDQLPGNGGLVWTTATPSQGSCTNPIVGNALNCSLGTIPAGASVTVTVTSAATTPAAACQSQPNPDAHATADGGLVADDSGSLNCTPPNTLAPGDAATIGFWANKNGQGVITCENGGANSTALGNWLASNFPNLFGSLAGKTNTQVAAAFTTAKGNAGGVQGNTYAQAFAVALAMYVTNSATGTQSCITKFGFNFGPGGTGTKTFNVGSNGAAFGVPNNTTLTVAQIMAIANANYNPATGLFYGGDQTLTSALNNVLNGINQGGDIS